MGFQFLEWLQKLLLASLKEIFLNSGRPWIERQPGYGKQYSSGAVAKWMAFGGVAGNYSLFFDWCQHEDINEKWRGKGVLTPLYLRGT